MQDVLLIVGLVPLCAGIAAQLWIVPIRGQERARPVPRWTGVILLLLAAVCFAVAAFVG